MSGEEKERREGFRWLQGWRKWLLVLLLCALATLSTFFWGLRMGGRAAEPAITGELISQQLRAVEELVSLEYNYTNVGRFEEQVDFYGWKVPFTLKSFIVSYDGVIKAGVDLTRIEVEIDDLAKTVTVRLPESQILSHEIPEDSIEVFDESDNPLNRITIEDYTGFTLDQKKAMEQRAADNGLLTGADEKARAAVESLLAMMPGMEKYTLSVK